MAFPTPARAATSSIDIPPRLRKAALLPAVAGAVDRGTHASAASGDRARTSPTEALWTL